MNNSSPALCVIGAGPAGLALALRLAHSGTEVTLVDAGGEGIDATAADLHAGPIRSAAASHDTVDGELVGGSLYRADHLEATRWRHPGGSSWRWGAKGRVSGMPSVRMVQASPIDFHARPALDIPAFPFHADEVLRYEADVLEFLGLAGHSFDIADYQDEHAEAPLDAARFYSKLFHFPQSATISRTRVAEAAAHPLIDLRTGLHLTGFERTGTRISAVTFATASGEVERLTPATVVLSIGGIENCRQLLLGAEAGTVPNPHDLLGRYFTDHPHIRLGYLEQANVSELAYYDFQDVRATPVLRGHGIQPDFAEATDAFRFSIDIVGRHIADATAAGYALAAARDELSRRNPKGLARHLARAARQPKQSAQLLQASRGLGVHHTGLGGWSDQNEKLHEVGVGSVESMFEQRPSWDNRIRLGEATDRYGARQPAIQWSFSRAEIAGVRHAAEITSDAFVDAGLGPLTKMTELGDGPIPRAGTGLHHMGGTRMSDDSSQGVVDREGRLHELDNLYVNGSSVFPTSVGYANPTFTVLQMAYRLADHLSGRALRDQPTIDLTMDGSAPAPQRSVSAACATPRATDH